MQKERLVEFEKLKLAYITVKNFLEKEAGENVESLKTKIAEDLSFYGDDNYYLLTKFVEKFELEHSNFNYDERFHSEGEIANSEIALYNLLILSVWLPLKTIELLSLNNVKINKPSFYKPSRKVTDMTFKELLTWYIEGKYTNSEIKYVLKNGI
ncbi:DUF1493 family protein [Flavobacterium sp. HJJ]|uniref:DUF1493 family protein n=1 Tax=Flavobacterium sp. HJJ TaxID=2783792 RepID=UPI00188C78F2|nr:DUF1493 family protein [Flavobacterium sp. HJJ]MBF4473191.1 DUF1493 family protein [Flavobacterium sp. HJJ]